MRRSTEPTSVADNRPPPKLLIEVNEGNVPVVPPVPEPLDLAQADPELVAHTAAASTA